MARQNLKYKPKGNSISSTNNVKYILTYVTTHKLTKLHPSVNTSAATRSCTAIYICQIRPNTKISFKNVKFPTQQTVSRRKQMVSHA